MCKTNMKTIFYYINICKHEHEKNMTRLWSKIMPKIGVEHTIGNDALPSPGVNPLEGSPTCSCGKLGLGRRSRLPTLERSRRSSWEPRD
jgi:hypothetical protein